MIVCCSLITGSGTPFHFSTGSLSVPEKIKKEDLEHIIIHERIHALQYHTLDLIVIELLTAVMWFNPLIWMMKNSIQLVHEYLADEGALNTGIDQHRYQALLINQITEDKLISLSSSFNHSLIKKRIKMMINKKFNRRSNLKIMALLPLAGFLFAAVALFNALVPREIMAAPSKPLNVLIHDLNLSDRPEIPADTIVNKTIRIVKNQEGTDTIITETYEVKMTGDAITEDPDSTKDVLINTNVMQKEKIVIQKSTSSDKPGNQELSNVLFIIDGVEHRENNAMLTVDPADIESIDVIKDKEMMKKYTDKDYEGVIIMKTKANKK